MSSTGNISNSVSSINASTGSSSASAPATGSAGTTSSSANPLNSYATSSNSGTLSSLGIGSGLNSNALISSLMSVAQAPITAVNNQIGGYQAEISAYGQLSGATYSFQVALGGLTSASAFQATAGTPSNTAVLSATTDSTAVAGNYSINVTALAQPETLVAAGQASQTASIGSGASTTLTFQFGTLSGGTAASGKYSGATFTQSAARPGGSVTINSSDNSLQGIASAINSANLGVSASIVNDGSGTPYRLSLSSSTTGAAGAMKISVNGDPALQALLGQDPAGTQNLTETQAAQDANLTVNGLAITSPTNTVPNTLTGTTLNLTGTGTTSLVVSQNTTAIQTNVQAFVTAYNTLDSTINTLTAAGVGGAAGGPLAGQFSALQTQSQLRQALNTTMFDAAGKSATLADIGITFQKDGSLALDTTKLSSAMAANSNEVGSLFAQNAVTSDSLVSFLSAGSGAAAGKYNINVGAMATQGVLTGASNAGSTITAGVNDGLDVVVDGVSASVTLPAGTYTATTLATAVQSAINGAPNLSKAGVSVSVAQNNGVLSVTSASYGSNSFVSLGGNAAGNLIGTGPTGKNGTDITGTINGQPATGSGQILTGLAGSAVDGVKLKVTGGSSGSRGNLSLSQGFANVLNNLATQFNSPTGLISTATNALNSNVTDDQNQVTRLNSQLTLLQAQYQAEFTQLDTLMSSLNATQSYLTNQLNSLASTTAYIYSGSSSSSG